jgi:DNA-3-methyladenine glycosylase II
MIKIDQLALAEDRLQKLDPILGELIELQKPIAFKPRTNYFLSLCRSVIGQQVSVAAAAIIFARFEAATALEPTRVLILNDATIKKIGLSRQKASYIKDLAQHFVDNPQVYNHLEKLEDDAVLAELIAIRGIGVWTAQMFLIFSLGRLDVFAPDDVGLQRAMKQLYAWRELPPKAELVAVAERWRPFRTVACWHLWKSLQNTPG